MSSGKRPVGAAKGEQSDTEVLSPPPPRLVGWVRDQKKSCVPKISLKFLPPLVNVIFLLEEFFFDVGGGWVGRGWPGPQTPPPPLLSNSLPATPGAAPPPALVTPPPKGTSWR